MDLSENVGSRLKVRRKAVNLTLRELAENTGLTASFLSQVERGKVSLSLASLQALARALDVPVLYFLSGKGREANNAVSSSEKVAPEPPPYSPVVRRDQRSRLVLPASGVEMEMMVPSLNQKMTSFKGCLKPGAEHVAAQLREPTEEFVYVISGELLVELEDGEYILHADESIYYLGRELRRMCGASQDEDAIWINVITPAVF
jgi:transcriptional regulator with XRE-family HTH domain